MLDTFRFLSESDPLEVLETQFGANGLADLAEEFGLEDSGTSRELSSRLLSHLGFSVPSPARDEGLEWTLSRLRMLADRTMTEVQPDILDAAAREGLQVVERLVRLGVFGWFSILWPLDWEEKALAQLRDHGHSASSLNRLSFGHVVALFRLQPGLLSHSALAADLEMKFGSAGVFDSQLQDFSSRLGRLVQARNSLVHPPASSGGAPSLEELRERNSTLLTDARRLVQDLASAHAVPRLARVVSETRECWGRYRCTLELDDGKSLTVLPGETLDLGEVYLYFGTRSNPLPVRPLMLKRGQVQLP